MTNLALSHAKTARFRPDHVDTSGKPPEKIFLDLSRVTH
jgi:hypothetical protein